jgi:hypothetical protein
VELFRLIDSVTPRKIAYGMALRFMALRFLHASFRGGSHGPVCAEPEFLEVPSKATGTRENYRWQKRELQLVEGRMKAGRREIESS